MEDYKTSEWLLIEGGRQLIRYDGKKIEINHFVDKNIKQLCVKPGNDFSHLDFSGAVHYFNESKKLKEERFFNGFDPSTKKGLKELFYLQPENKPSYIVKAIQEGLLDSDGIRIALNSSIDKLAEFLYKNVENLSPDLLKQFRKKNGKPYAMSSLKEAVKRAKP